MIGYVTLGTNDLDKAARFYDELLGSIGIGRFMEIEGYFVAWAAAAGSPALSVTRPYNQEPATVGNGVMVALIMPDRATVDAFYAKAMELGATDEGPPGPRGDAPEGFYAAYFRDLDGNKLNAFCSPR
jgi:catechol 2,3-dioxygenase-like lactoylglutathione lyase family enzyme